MSFVPDYDPDDEKTLRGEPAEDAGESEKWERVVVGEF